MNVPGAIPRIVRFGPFEFDLGTRVLRKHGMHVRLTGQPVDVLAVLLQHSGEVVTREALQERLWPSDTYVDFEHSLNTAIRRLRAALGDSADSPRYIETLSRRGYRFIAPLDQSQQSLVQEAAQTAARTDKPAVRRHSLQTIAIVSGLVLLASANVAVLYIRGSFGARTASPQIRSIAVVPFADTSGPGEQDYLADEISDAVRQRLAAVRSLRVISRVSSAHFEANSTPVREIAKALNADAIVEGSVRRSGNRLRVSVELIRAATDTHIWGGSFETDINGILALQESISERLAREIGPVLTPTPRQPLAHTSIYNPDAFRAYATGRFLWNKRTEESIKKAILEFQQAVVHDPNYALALDGLADCWIALGWYGNLSPADSFPRAKEAIGRALDVDGSLAEAHTSLAFVTMYYDRDWAAAEAEFRRAIDSNPNYANGHHWYAEFLSLTGRHEEAIAEAERAREIDPLSGIINTWVGSRYFFAQRYDKAISLYQGAVEMDPGFVPAHLVLGEAYEQLQRPHQAIAELETAVRLSGGSAIYVASLVHAYGAAGRRQDAEKLRGDLKRLSQEKFVSSYDLAIASLGLGDTPAVLRLLERAVYERSPRVAFIGVDPRFNGLQRNSLFRQLKSRIGIP